MKIISVWNPKGGQGKSMLSINLAAASVEMGLVPLVICQDQQGTSMLFYNSGNLPFKVMNEIPEKKPDVDLLIFDHQASDWEVPRAQFIVMPVKPARDQYATYIDAYKRAEDQGKEILTVVTDGHTHRLDENTTTALMKKKGAYIIPSSGVFSRASGEYRTIFDDKLNKAYKIKERRNDINKILGRILVNKETEEGA